MLAALSGDRPPAGGPPAEMAVQRPPPLQARVPDTGVETNEPQQVAAPPPAIPPVVGGVVHGRVSLPRRLVAGVLPVATVAAHVVRGLPRAAHETDVAGAPEAVVVRVPKTSLLAPPLGPGVQVALGVHPRPTTAQRAPRTVDLGALTTTPHAPLGPEVAIVGPADVVPKPRDDRPVGGAIGGVAPPRDVQTAIEVAR